ncbi:MAG: hypothetical protein H6719_18550 [Sandaracinaceae bacterium]|nr:hypothetical protein [Sandaracinaceae bacterium]
MRPRPLVALALVALASLLAVAPASAQDARAALRRYGCASCHAVESVRVSRGQSCTGCHQALVERQRGRGRAPTVRHYVNAPDLSVAGSRLREEYLVAFLQDPHDARPRLEETMPRLPVTEADARILARWIRRDAPTVPAGPAPSRANVEAGRAVFTRVGCATCHELGNLDFGRNLPPEALMGLGRAAYEAPNLRFARERLDPDVALAWIEDPRAVNPRTQMPETNLSHADAILVRDFLWFVDPGAPATPARVNLDLSPMERRVRFGEVRRIFDRSCIHCHAHTDGQSASALGFEPSSLDLSSLEGVRAGVTLPDGSHRSILEADDRGLPPLVYRLMRRHEEAARDVTSPRADPLAPIARTRPDEPVGMPLGLPPVDASDVRLIATWIAQGAQE